MSELSNPNSQSSSLLISDLIRLSSFILSHPLYFFYFLFFSPHLLKLISFLSPLFLTTFLLFITEFPKTPFSSILERLQFKKDSPNAEPHLSDEMYEALFGHSSTPATAETEQPHVEENKFSPKLENSCVVMEEKRLENFFKILNEFERLASNVDEMKRGAKPNKAVEKPKPPNDVVNLDSSSTAKSHSQRIPTPASDDEATSFEMRAESCVDSRSNNLSRYGSMRREREWERTLACKLYEERHNVGGGGGGGEGMDSLWEAYEAEDFVVSRSQVGRRRRREKVLERESEEEEEEDDEVGGQLCYLQALKLSAGKMVVGVGKPNLVKISKAIKGFGWLGKSGKKSSKKVHNHGKYSLRPANSVPVDFDTEIKKF